MWVRCIFTSMGGKVEVVKYCPKDTWLALPIGSHTSKGMAFFRFLLYLFDCLGKVSTLQPFYVCLI